MMTIKFVSRQRGAALFVALVLIIILSLLGIVAMRGGFTQRLIASNSAQTVSAISAADSAASALINAVNDTAASDSAGDPMYDAVQAGTGNDISQLMDRSIDAVTRCLDSTGALQDCPAENLDQDQGDRVQAKAQITYFGSGSRPDLCAGFQLNMGAKPYCHYFRVDGVGTYGDTEKTVSVIAVRTGYSTGY